jgi:xanthosine utilization system XapX-like protein
VAKKFIEIISTLFGDITDEKYKYEVTETALEKMGTSLIPVPFLGLLMSIPISVPPILVFNSLLPILGVLMGSSMMACILAILMYRKKVNSTRDKLTRKTISL